jgi:protein-S-isoprenylcysteine O-methyltransferase Ste14
MKACINYFQLTALLFFLILIVGRSLYLWFAHGVRTFVLGRGKKGIGGVLEVLFFLGFFFWIAEVILSSIPTDVRLGPSVLEVKIVDAPAAQIVGVVMVAAGLALFIWALLSFGASWRVGIDKGAPGRLITTGAFGFSRNPIFLSLDVYFVGTFLINGTIVFFLISLIVILGTHYQIVQEEKHLRKSYGPVYDAYCAKTGRYVTLGRRAE